MNFFIPTERNHYRAKVLQPSFLFFSVFAFLLFQSVLGFIAVARPGVLGYSSEITPEKIVNLTNLKRQEAGLAPLKLNPVLSEAATRKAGDMFAFNYWAHTSPSGRTPWTFFKEAGYQYLVGGEN